MTTVAVLGTGIMGAPIARRLLGEGFDVRVWNRSREKADPLADDGATVCDTPRDAAEGAEVILTMLLDAAAVEATMSGDDGALAAAGDDVIWTQTSTVGIEGSDRLATLAADSGVTYVDAPVLGTREPAEQGQLVVLASGPDAARERLAPVYDAIGQRTMWLGEAGAGSRLKLVVNSWVLAVTTAVAEGMALAEGLGLSPQLLLDAVEGGALDLPYAHLKGGLIQQGEFPAAFELAGAAKDAGLIVAAAKQAGVRLEVADAVRRQLERARDDGHAEEDMAAVWYAARG
jgi:3-hydroxyisobutyrate dehydrogenase